MLLSKPLKLIVGPWWLPSLGVVEDDVEDHLDPGLVQRLHHVAELARRGCPPPG